MDPNNEPSISMKAVFEQNVFRHTMNNPDGNYQNLFINEIPSDSAVVYTDTKKIKIEPPLKLTTQSNCMHNRTSGDQSSSADVTTDTAASWRRKRKLSKSKGKVSKFIRKDCMHVNCDRHQHICSSTNIDDRLGVFQTTCSFNHEGEEFIACAMNISQSIHGSLGMTCLGSGSYGCVDSIMVTSRNGKVKKPFAVKRITISTSGNHVNYTLKEQEIYRQSSQHNQKFTIQYFGCMMYEGQIYIVLEKMDANLTRFNRAIVQLGYAVDKPVPMVFIKLLTYSLIEALDFLKTVVKIIHRDIKPSNILLSNKDLSIKISDFGVAADDMAIRRTVGIGSKPYMAPERLYEEIGPYVGLFTQRSNPETRTYDHKCDIWSVGLTLIETLTGEYPYGKNFRSQTINLENMIVNGPSPGIKNSKLYLRDKNCAPGEVRALLNFVETCLIKDTNHSRNNDKQCPLYVGEKFDSLNSKNSSPKIVLENQMPNLQQKVNRKSTIRPNYDELKRHEFYQLAAKRFQSPAVSPSIGLYPQTQTSYDSTYHSGSDQPTVNDDGLYDLKDPDSVSLRTFFTQAFEQIEAQCHSLCADGYIHNCGSADVSLNHTGKPKCKKL